MVRRTMGLPYKSKPKNFYRVVWVYYKRPESGRTNRCV